jgi:RNA polymerase sigma-70 factor (ECF subfamily)
MCESSEPESEQLIRQAAAGDREATDSLLSRYRSRVRKMVAIRMDKRLAARVDPSDIVQEALADAAQKLPDYLNQQPLPFYPWLRQLACERLIQQQRHHIGAKARTVTREQGDACALPDHSAVELVDQLLASGTSPSAGLMREELQQRVQNMLEKMATADREVLVLRYLEQLSITETAAVLGLTADGVKSRQRRALERFSNMLADQSRGNS